MRIFFTVPCTFPMVLTRRVCRTIKNFLRWRCCHVLCLIQQWYCKLEELGFKSGVITEAPRWVFFYLLVLLPTCFNDGTLKSVKWRRPCHIKSPLWYGYHFDKIFSYYSAIQNSPSGKVLTFALLLRWKVSITHARRLITLNLEKNKHFTIYFVIYLYRQLAVAERGLLWYTAGAKL